MLPSDPDYKPAATDPRILESEEYRKLLSENVDPFQPYSYNASLVQLLEEALLR